ncbi:hypothetical protein ACVWW6_000479 [Bradyrhizobium sp. USDA 3311]
MSALGLKGPTIRLAGHKVKTVIDPFEDGRVCMKPFGE